MKSSPYILDGYSVSDGGARIELTLASPVRDNWGRMQPIEKARGFQFLVFYDVIDYDLRCKANTKILDIYQLDGKGNPVSNDPEKSPSDLIPAGYQKWVIEGEAGLLGYVVCKGHSGPLVDPAAAPPRFPF